MNRLNDQIEILENRIREAMLDPRAETIGLVAADFKTLKFMLEGLSSFVEHRWQVKLIFGRGVVSENVDINAEHLEEAREKAISMVDKYDSAIDYELYCDGIQILEEN